MKRIAGMSHGWLAWIAPCLLFHACSSVNLPSIEESQRAIERLKPLLEENDKAINFLGSRLPAGQDLIVRIRASSLNVVAAAVAGQRTDDVRIAFLPTRPLLREDKSVLGISYANTLDVDTGDLTMDLAVLRFERFRGNVVDAAIAIGGKGRIKISGRYTGIPASASPDIEMKLDETVRFDIAYTDSGNIVLRPQKKELKLRVTFKVKIIEWYVPYSRDIPLQATDLIPPLKVPMSFSATIPFPVPVEEFADERMTFAPHRVEFLRTMLHTVNDILELRSDFRFTGIAR